MSSTERRIKTAAVTIVSAMVLAQGSSAAGKIPGEAWMGIYLGGSKIGFSSYRIDKSEFEGKPGFRIDTSSFVRVRMLGEELTQDVKGTVYTDQEFTPVYQTLNMSSGGRTTRVTARFGKDRIAVVVESEGTKTPKTIFIPSETRLLADSNLMPDLAVGESLSFKHFDPVKLQLEDVRAEVVGKEEIEIAGVKQPCLTIKVQDSLGESTYLRGEDGGILKIQTPVAGFNMVREPQETAVMIPSGIAGDPSEDLGAVSSIRTAVKIADPNKVKYLKLKLSGAIDKGLIFSDPRQKVEFSEGEAVYEIKAVEFRAEDSVSLPIKRTEFEEHVIGTPYIQPADSRIAEKAREIVGGEKNAYLAAAGIRKWVRENMRTQGNMGILRPSVDVLRTRTGVCRDYSVLYAALARSAGVPTRMVTGMTYWNDGFYYHAWAESWVGKWIPMDATLDTDFVDGTHIKLAEGDTAIFDAARVIGNLEAEIVSYE